MPATDTQTDSWVYCIGLSGCQNTVHFLYRMKRNEGWKNELPYKYPHYYIKFCERKCLKIILKCLNNTKRWVKEKNYNFISLSSVKFGKFSSFPSLWLPPFPIPVTTAVTLELCLNIPHLKGCNCVREGSSTSLMYVLPTSHGRSGNIRSSSSCLIIEYL